MHEVQVFIVSCVTHQGAAPMNDRAAIAWLDTFGNDHDALVQVAGVRYMFSGSVGSLPVSLGRMNMHTGL